MNGDMMVTDFTTVTELPGVGAHRQQRIALLSRYSFARQFSEGKDVLEVACGAGLGLGYLARTARHVVGGDIDDGCLEIAGKTYAGRSDVSVQKLNAQELPFGDNSFDVVLLFEAIYYLKQPERFFSEAQRVLRPGGVVLIVSVNCEWHGFNPSPFSVRYLSGSELAGAMRSAGFEPDIKFCFPDKPRGLLGSAVSSLRRAAVRMHLIPKTMRGKELLKRIFYGPVTPLEPELRDDGEAPAALHDVSIENGPIENFLVIYAVGKLRNQ
jgi:SAM-dependent methyltransferase